MRKKYVIAVPILITLVLIAFSSWDSVFVRAQEFFYHMYYSNQPKSVTSRIEIKTLTSKLLQNSSREVRIYIPEAYDKYPSTHFPTLYLLHGYPGSNADWLTNTNLQGKLDSLIKSGTIPSMIVIFPDGNGPVVHDSQYLNATIVNQPMESHLTRELIPFIDSQYRTDKRREKRAIGGISSGAYGAINIGLRNNELFGFIFSHSGYFMNREAALPDLLGSNKQKIQENNPLEYMKKQTLDPKTYIYFDIGKADSRAFIKDNQDFDKLLKQRSIPHTLKLTNGWHNWNAWAENIFFSLQEYSYFLKKYN